MSDHKAHGFGTRAIHAGQAPDPVTGAVMTPIYYTSTYAQSAPGVHKGFEYSRTHNLTRFALEANLASLEGGAGGLCFASGLAATATLLDLFDAGSHVVACDDLYGGTFRLFDKVYRRLGFEFSYVDPASGRGGRGRRDQGPTTLVWIETPTNPMLKIVDIAAVAAVCKPRKGVLLAVDNTFMTPYFQRPLELGADIVAHSLTKYLNGHSDVIGGALVFKTKELCDRVQFLQNAAGAVPSPMDSFLVLRGTKTLHVRMERHEHNARALASWLERHPQVERAIYPGLGVAPAARARGQAAARLRRHDQLRAEGRDRSRAAVPVDVQAVHARRVARRRRVADRAPGDHDARERAGGEPREARHRRRLHPAVGRHRGPRRSAERSRGLVRGGPRMTNAPVLRSLRSCIYQVDDLARAKAFYTAAFGIEPYFDQPFYVGYQIGGQELGLDPDVSKRKPGPGGAVGFWRVDNIAATWQHLLAARRDAGRGAAQVGGTVRGRDRRRSVRQSPRHHRGRVMIDMILEGRPRDLGGFAVARVLPQAARRSVGPFVFLDHMGPADVTGARGAAASAPAPRDRHVSAGR